MNSIVNITAMFFVLMSAGIYEANAQENLRVGNYEVRDEVAIAAGTGAVIGVAVAAPAVVVGAGAGIVIGAASVQVYEKYTGKKVSYEDAFKLVSEKTDVAAQDVKKAVKTTYYKVSDKAVDVKTSIKREIEDYKGEGSFTRSVERGLADMETKYERTIRDLSL